VLPDVAADHLRKALDGFGHLAPHLDGAARERARELEEAHRRVRQAAGIKGLSYRAEPPATPPDVLGLYVYLPKD
jgi:hypothetical protein